MRRDATYTIFNGGIWSEELWGRSDLAKYPNAARDIVNMLPLVLGPLRRRMGTVDIGAIGGPSAWLGRFVFNDEQACALEWSPGTLRFIQAGQLVRVGDAPYEVATPFTAADLPLIRTAQSADVVFVVCPGHRPQKLSRFGTANWTLTPISFRDGPYRDPWPGQPSVTLAGSTLTFSAPVAESDWLGQCIRVMVDGKWYWTRVTGVPTTLTATVAVDADADATPEGEITQWRAPAWGGSRGWPEVVSLFEERTWWAAPNAEPTSLWASVTGDYATFSPTEQDGKVVDDNGLYIIMADREVSGVRWMMPGQAMVLGTSGGEYSLRASALGEALTPESCNVRPETDEGAARVEPIRIDNTVAIVRRDGRGLPMLGYDSNQDALTAPDAAQLAPELLFGRVVQLAWCRHPDRILWCITGDGELLSLTWGPADQVSAWARHPLGGNAKALSIVAVPEAEGDALYLVTERTIAGVTRRRVERMADRWVPQAGETDARRGLWLDAARSVTGTAIAQVTGLDHLEGATVSLLVDGAVQPARTVNGGAVTLDDAGSIVHVGLACPYRYVGMDIDNGSPGGSGQGRPKALNALSVRFRGSIGASVGIAADGAASNRMQPLPFRLAADPMDTAPQLWGGWLRVDPPQGTHESMRIVIEGSDPLPCTVTAVTITSNTN